MAELFKNKYSIASTRLQSWDYGSNGAYFITICTHNREHFFGEINDGKMELSEIGEHAEKYWHEIPDHFPFVHLGAFVVMPDHIHGIIIIDKSDDNPVESPKLGGSTVVISITNKNQQTAAASEKWKPATIGVIVNQYKRIVTIQSRKTHPGFGWQTRFHDHIIRNHESFVRIENYIINNPKKWDENRFQKKT